MKTIRHHHSFISTGSVFLLFMVFLGGCAALKKSEKEAPPPPEPINLAHPFTDVPVPKGFKRDLAKSFVYETRIIKVGRLFFSGNTNPKLTVKFYRNEMINHGWVLTNSIANKESILNYEKQGWTCTVIVEPTSFNRSDIEIQIGPIQKENQIEPK